MDNHGIDVARFDSEEVETSLRYSAWKENMGVLFDVEPRDDGAPDVHRPALIEAADLGGMVLARARAEGQTFSRTVERLRREELGLILVQYFSKGGGHIRGGERLCTGDMQIVDTEQPYELIASDYENLTLMVPYSLRGRISPVIETLHGRPISGRNPLIRLLGDHLQSLWRNVPEMTSTQASIALEGTLGLLQRWLVGDAEVSEALEPAVAASLGAAMRRHIERHLAEAIHAEDLARHFRVSRSQVYRLFQPHQGVARYVLVRRLERAFRLLSTPLLRERSIGAIALDCGFSSEAYFSRVFRARFGATASEVRASALAMAPEQQRRCIAGPGYSTEVYAMVRRLADAGGSAGEGAETDSQ
jgi:AraC-like DNA-binding protein